MRYLLARGMTYNDDGTLSFPSDAVCELTIKIEALQSQVADGTFVLDREDDVLTRALWNKDYPGRAQGVGLVPWKVAFENDLTTYRIVRETIIEKI